MLKIKETAETIKTNAKTANQKVIKTSDKVVEETLAAGEQWQNILAKALKTGTIILGQQQEVALNVIEGARDQFVAGNVRFRKLFGLQNFDTTKTAKKVVKTVKKEVVEATEKVAAVKQEVVKVAKKDVAVAKKNAIKAAGKAAAKATKVVGKVAPKAKVAAPKVAKIVKPKAVVKVTVARTDLKTIAGIGPKMEQVLNKLNITTFTQLAAFDAKALKDLLVAENPRYAMYEPQLWVAEAKKLMK